MMRKIGNKGFTLIEVILVLAILAIVVVILAPNILILLDKNQVKSCQSLKSNIEAASKMYTADKKYELGITCGNTKTIYGKDLIEAGYLENTGGSQINDKNGTTIDLENVVIDITYDCSTKVFSYDVKIVCE